MADGTITVTIYDNAFASQGTIASAFLPKGSFLRNESGDGSFVFPIYDTPAKTLVQYNRIAVVTVEDSSGNDVVICAFHIQNITPRRVRSGNYDGYVVEVSGAGILHELTYDNVGYTTVSDGSQGPTTAWFSTVLAFAQNTWTPYTMGSLPSGVSNEVYLRTAGESVLDAIEQAIQQSGVSMTYTPRFAIASTAALRRQIMFINDSQSGASSIAQAFVFQNLDLVKGVTSTAFECTVLDIEPIEETSEVTTRVTAYGAGIGADVLTIADAQGLVTVPTGFTVIDWDESIIANSTLEAVSGQPRIHRLHQFGHIKSEDNGDTTANQTAAIQLFWAAINFLRDRQVSRRAFYRVTFLGYPGADYTVGQLANLVYSESSPIDAAGASNQTDVIDINDDFVIHELHIEVPNSGKYKGKRLITALLGEVIATGTYLRPLPDGDGVVINKLKEHDEILRHATAAASPSTPGGTGTYATADAPFLVVSNTTNLTNERAFVAGAGLAATDGGANGNYTVDVATADTSMTINANSIQVRLASTSGLQISTGLMIADTVAGAGLTIASKVLAVGAGDGIDVAADSISVDVTDIIGNGLVEVATNNIALGTPTTLTVSTTNAVGVGTHAHAITTTAVGAASTIMATDANGRTQVDGIGINTTATTDGAIVLADDGWIGLGASAGRLLFDNQTTDILRVIDADVHMNDGSNDTLQIRSSGNVGTEADIFALGDLGIAAQDDFWIYIDANNDSTDGAVRIGKNAETSGGSTEIHTINEDGSMEWRSGVSHGMTDLARTATWAQLEENQTDNGGALLRGLTDASNTAPALRLSGVLSQTPDSTDTSSSYGAVRIEGSKKNGTAQQDLGSSENVFVVANRFTARLLVKGNGDLHVTNTSLTALDDEDDVSVARALQKAISGGKGIRPSVVDAGMTYSREDLERLGVLCGDFITYQGSLAAVLGAIVQIGGRVMALETGN